MPSIARDVQAVNTFCVGFEAALDGLHRQFQVLVHVQHVQVAVLGHRARPSVQRRVVKVPQSEAVVDRTGDEQVVA